MSSLRNIARLNYKCTRSLRTGAVSQVKVNMEKYKKFKELQAEYQSSDLPMYNRKTPTDRLLFATVTVSTGVMFLVTMLTFYELVQK